MTISFILIGTDEKKPSQMHDGIKHWNTGNYHRRGFFFLAQIYMLTLANADFMGRSRAKQLSQAKQTAHTLCYHNNVSAQPIGTRIILLRNGFHLPRANVSPANWMDEAKQRWKYVQIDLSHV